MGLKGKYEDEHFLLFTLNQQQFGVGISQIREISKLPSLTPLPQAPSYILGVFQKGQFTIPVVDLRRRLNYEPRELSPTSSLILAETAKGPVATIVDDITAVIPLHAFVDSAYRGQEPASAILGLGLLEQEIIVLLSPQYIFDF